MSFVYSRRFSHPPDRLTLELRDELYDRPFEQIDFPAERNSISSRDNYHPKSLLLCILNWLLVYIWLPLLRPNYLKKRGEDWAFRLVQYEDANTQFANLGPVNGPMNTLACYIHDGPDSHSVREHRVPHAFRDPPWSIRPRLCRRLSAFSRSTTNGLDDPEHVELIFGDARVQKLDLPWAILNDSCLNM